MQMFSNPLTKSALQYIRRPLYRNSFLLMANTIATTGLGFLFWMVVARFFTEAEVGWGAAVISAMTLLARFSTLGFGNALVRFLPRSEKPKETINSCFTLSGIVALALAAIFIAGMDLWSPALGFVRGTPLFAVAFACFVLIWTLSGLVDFVFVARRRAEFVLSKGIIFSLLKIPLPVLLVLYFHTFGIAAAWGISAGVAVLVSLLFFLPRVQNHYRPMPMLNLHTIRTMWKYSLGSYLAGLFTTAPTLILPIMVVNIAGAAYNAYFYVAWTIASLLFAIPFTVSHSLFAEGATFEHELRSNVQRSLKLIFLLLVPAIALLLLLGNWLLSLFGDNYSTNGFLLLLILGISSIFVGIIDVYKSILRVQNRIRELAIICGLTAVAVLLGSYLAMPIIGIVGAGYVWLAAQGLAAVYVLFALKAYWRK
jgi:O-antigen/teichoic acid export membrane protein